MERTPPVEEKEDGSDEAVRLRAIMAAAEAEAEAEADGGVSLALLSAWLAGLW